MTLLDPGIVVIAAVAGATMSFLGLGVSPEWSILFVLQLLVSVTVFPAAVFCTILLLLAPLSDGMHRLVIRSGINAATLGIPAAMLFGAGWLCGVSFG